MPSAATNQNYGQTCTHTRVHTLTRLLTLASSPLHPRRSRTQLCLAGRRRRLSARPGDVAALPAGLALPAPGAGAGTAAGAQSEDRTLQAAPRRASSPLGCLQPHWGGSPCPTSLQGAASGPRAQRAPAPFAGNGTGRMQAGGSCPQWSTPWCTPAPPKIPALHIPATQHPQRPPAPLGNPQHPQHHPAAPPAASRGRPCAASAPCGTARRCAVLAPAGGSRGAPGGPWPSSRCGSSIAAPGGSPAWSQHMPRAVPAPPGSARGPPGAPSPLLVHRGHRGSRRFALASPPGSHRMPPKTGTGLCRHTSARYGAVKQG